MFIDEATIEAKAGDGGNGCHSYEKMKYKPKGRPDGGNGGRGGSIILIGSSTVHTLQDVAYRRHYKASRGAHGKGSNKFGRSGEDILIKVPLGTVVYNKETNEPIADCLEQNQKVVVAKAGRGGRGNATLANFKNPNPERSEEGKPGEEKILRLELKVLADVGLVGRPNAGKSTFITSISHARPKIADYPFTTKEPHLGIVKLPSIHESFVMADIPGLIENCHEGKGLGIKFLRHIERTRVLAILVEATCDDPLEEASILLKELNFYSEALAEKPKCFIMTKIDLLPEEKRGKIPDGWLSISAVTSENIDTVIKKMWEMLTVSRKSES